MPIPPKKMQAFIQQSKKKPNFPMKKGKPEEDEQEQEEQTENPGNPKEKEEEKDYSKLVEEEAKRVADGDGDEELMQKITGYDSEIDGNPPAWVEDESTWEKAKEAVDPEGEGAKYDEPYAVVAHVYKRMGGAIAD